MIRILIVDDSETVRQLLTYELNRQPNMDVVGLAKNGMEAIQLAERLKPDVITMDFKMPQMNGLDATREIMCTNACPVIIVSQYWSQHDKQNVFDALEAGAISVVNKPTGPGHPDYEASLDHLLKTIRMMSEVKVITRRRNKPLPTCKPHVHLQQKGICPPACRPNCPANEHTGELVAIGASTGGPVAIRTVLENLPAPYPLPILIVQHIAPGFLNGLVDWLKTTTGHSVEIATQGIKPAPGHIYFAPDDHHMGIDSHGHIRLVNTPKENSLRPAVSYLFRTVAQHRGNKTIAILLTGMGADGSNELKLIKDAGGATVIQDEESCIVFGMPGEALRVGAARHILSPTEISQFLRFATSNSDTLHEVSS